MPRGWLLVAIVVVAACGGPTTTPVDPTHIPASTSDRAGAPAIKQPRDLRSRAADPCGTLLSRAQLGELGFARPGELTSNDLGPTCAWEAGGTASRKVEASVVVTRDLFIDTYAARALPIFRPYVLSGLPAVDSQSFGGAPTCTTTVGVADRQTLDVSSSRGTYAGDRDADACAISRRAAEEIVSTLPPL